MLGTAKCCSVQMAPHFLPIKLQFLWLLLFHKARVTLQELACSWPQHEEKGHVQEWGWMKCDFWIIFSAFFLLLFTTTLLGGCTSSNSKYLHTSVCKSGQSSSSAGIEKNVFGLPPKLWYRSPASIGLPTLSFWAVVFPEAVESKLEWHESLPD